MKALVLTCDSYRPFTLNLLSSYERLWPKNPFVFYVPFQELGNIADSGGGVMVHSGPSIQETMLTLLRGIPDEEFVYWCIDDKFPTWVDRPALGRLIDALHTGSGEGLDAVAFTRTKGLLRDIEWDRGRLLGLHVLRRPNLSSFWLHQVMRAGILRDFFSALPSIERPSQMETYKSRWLLSQKTNAVVTKKSLITFGESTRNGQPTANVLRSMARNHIGLGPGFQTTPVDERPRKSVFGTKGFGGHFLVGCHDLIWWFERKLVALMNMLKKII